MVTCKCFAMHLHFCIQLLFDISIYTHHIYFFYIFYFYLNVIYLFELLLINSVDFMSHYASAIGYHLAKIFLNVEVRAYDRPSLLPGPFVYIEYQVTTNNLYTCEIFYCDFVYHIYCII